MADGVFLVLGNLSERAFKTKLLGHEHGVVTKALAAAQLVPNAAFDRALDRRFVSRLVDECESTHEAPRALLVGHTLKFGEHLGVVRGIVAMRARIARRVHARPAIEGIDHEPRIVCERSHARGLVGGASLDERIADERIGVFLGLGIRLNLRQSQKLPARKVERGLDFFNLVLIVGCNDDFHFSSTPFREQKRVRHKSRTRPLSCYSMPSTSF